MATQIAPGYVDIQHLFNQRIADVSGGSRMNWDAVQESVAAYNQHFAAMTGALVQDVTVGMEWYAEPTGGTLQPLDEYGNPLPVREGRGWQNGYPIYGAGTAWGDDRVSRQMMTFEESNRHTVEAQNRDKDWNKRRIISALLTAESYTFFDQTRDLRFPEGLGNLTVNPLANNDGVLYTRRDGSAATDNHYLAQNAEISDATGANPFPAIWENLSHHPANYGRRIIVYVATNLVDSVSNLAGFVERRDPDISPGDNETQIANQVSSGFGDEYVGYVRAPGFCHIVSWGDLPDNYMLATVEGVAPVARRQYPIASLQGLIPEDHSPDGNRQIHRLLRYAGYGVRNRVGALVMQVNAGAYATPEDYTAPLAV